MASPVRPPWRRWGREAGFVFLGGLDRLWPRLWIILAAVALGMGAVLLFSPQDNALLAHIRVPDAPRTDNVAKFLSQWGDLNGAGPLAILIWVLGAISSRVRWRKLGLALLMACLVSGLILNIFRIGTGRPRPYYQHAHPEVMDKFYGPQPGKGYMQSFPSGHACTSATTGSALGAVSPVLVLPGAAYAVAVSWSRLQLDRHHPIDILVGATIGITCGLSFASTVPGAWIKLRRRRKSAGRRLARR